MPRSRQAIFAGGIPQPILWAPLVSSLALTRGQGNATSTRTTTATVQDFEGLLKTAKVGEARFVGARRVENFLTATENFSSANWASINAGTGVPMVKTPNYGSIAAPDGTFSACRVQLDRGASNTSSDYSGINTSNLSGFPTSGKACGSVWLRAVSGTCSLNIRFNGAGATLTLDTTWRRYSYLDTTYAAFFQLITRGTYGDTQVCDFLMWHPQLENVVGQSNQAPGDYVSNGVMPSPLYHGAGVDGVKYFPYQNGNTVASNIVTEAQGANISASTLVGYIHEDQRNCICKQNRRFDITTHVGVSGGSGTFTDGETVTATGGGTGVYRLSQSTSSIFALSSGTGTFTGTLTGGTSGATRTIGSATAVWVATNCTVTNNQTGADGVANTACTLTATAANATVLQNVTSSSAARASGCWIKRITGAGTINLTQDNGATWTPVTVTSAWAKVDIENQTLTNPTFGVQIVTNGDAVAIDYFCHEVANTTGTPPVSIFPVETVTTSVTRNADSLAVQTAGNFSDVAGTCIAEITPLFNTSSFVYGRIIGYASGTTASPLAFNSKSQPASAYDGTLSVNRNVTITAGVTQAIGSSWGNSVQEVFCKNGSASDAYNQNYSHGVTTLTIGNGNSGATPFCAIRNLKIYGVKLSGSYMLSATK